MTPLEIIRRKKIFRYVSAFMALNILAGYFTPTAAYALTSGPGQEEFSSFEPVSTSDMVDLYTGDFNYNIPVMSVPGPNGGYPINIAYHSGIGMDQEASWVGLGWNINVGAINRQMRGLPDDFSGDEIVNKYSLRNNITVAVGLDINKKTSEFLGIPRNYAGYPGFNTQVYYNTYKGLGYRLSSTQRLTDGNLGFASAGVHFDSQSGIGFEPNFTINKKGWFKGFNSSGGLSINAREGLQNFSFALGGYALSGEGKTSGAAVGIQGSSSLSFGMQQNVPFASLPVNNTTFAFDLNVLGVAGQRSDGPNITTDNLPGYFENFGLSFWSGYVNISSIGSNTSTPSYGYLYDNNSNDNSLRDFNRDPFEYNKKIPNLPSSTVSYDVYMLSGQGVGGYFRPYQQSVRSYSNQNRSNNTNYYRLNAEAGIDWDALDVTNEYHVGLGFSYGWGGTETGSWSDINTADAAYLSNFESYDAWQNPAKEYSPFKLYGENTAVLLSDEDQLSEWNGDDAVRVELNKETGEGGWLNAHFEATTNASDGIVTSSAFDFTASDALLHKDQRERRATNIEYFTKQHALLYGFTKNIGYEDAQDDNDLDNVAKVYPTYAQSHHISEVSILKPDGMRYTYGLPAYNTEQSDAYFSVQANGSTFNTTTIAVPQTNGEIDPTGTPENFLSEQKLPAYVHSWLLTSVVSADYLDLTGDGPTDDDYGYWVRFNYKKTSSDYNWRVPYADASFIVGNASDINDDKGSFSFGKKELYYIESVETKTHIAIFTTSRREDAVAADGKFATDLPSVTPPTGTATNSMYKLDQIALYSKAEYYLDITNRELRSNPLAIQKAHFKYTYDLCPNVPNNTNANVDENGQNVQQNDPANINTARGKLTLKKLYFTYESSSRGEVTPYVFHYDNSNPQYDRSNMDRWGNYKNNDSYNVYPYVDFPYTEQDVTPDAGVWSLSSIELPTGADMKITYESDEYKYVESKRAERMFDIVGTEDYTNGGAFEMSRTTTGNPAGLGEISATNDGEYRVYFKLEHPYATSTGVADFFRDYLDNGKLDTVFFKVNADIKGAFGSYYDYVSGYARVSYDEVPGIASNPDYNILQSTPSGQYDIGYITLSGEDLQRGENGGLKVHPFTRAGIEHLRYNRPDIATTPVPQSPGALNQAVNFISSIVGSMNDVAGMIAGYNAWAFMKGFSKKIKLNGWSVIRLQDPDSKFGGGDRVSKLEIEDTWNNDGNINNRDQFNYGQKYSYTLEDGTSSGVAYEPQIGGEESALRSPRPYSQSIHLNGIEHLYIENPITESYYPGARVGYSRVTVSSTAPDKALAESSSADNKLLHTAAPISIYEFFTPKDFPVLFDETPITADPSIVRPIMIPGIYTNYKKYMARSQGYSVVLNDMAGKLKSIEIRTRPVVSGTSNNTNGSLISRQTFIYNTEAPYSEDKINRLSSKVQVMSCSTGTVQYQTALVGQSHDIFLDMNENREFMNTLGLDLNLDLQFSANGVPTFFFLMPLIHISRSDVRQRTVVVNKIIHRSGILKEVITTDHESTVKNTYVAFDKETGEPLLTKITNEFEDDVYGFTYPAHWYYPAMQGAYKNYGVEISAVTSPGTFPITPAANGRINLQSYLPTTKNANDYFTPGDKIWVDFTAVNDAVYTVVKVGVNGANEYIDCISESGNLISTDQINSIRIIRSGYLNLQTLAAGSLTSRTFGVTPFDAFTGNGLQTNTANVAIDEAMQILNASAVEYTDVWQAPCKDCDGITMPNSTVNPYRWGIRGKWRPLKSFAFYVGRSQSDNIIEDGIYTDFEEFKWLDPSNANSKWTSATTVTKYSPHGYELENKDAIGNYSAALFEFGESMATAVGSNSKHKELAFDSFEDYAYVNYCNYQFDHWGFSPSDAVDISSSQHHTGKYSLRITQATGSKSISRTLLNNDCESFQSSRKLVVPPTDGSSSTPYVMDQCDCIGKFSPEVGKKYVISSWVKETSAMGLNTPTYAHAKVKVELLDAGGLVLPGGTFTFSPSGAIIEGWQRVYGEFEIITGTATVKVTYLNTATAGEECYFDDTRIHPFDGQMATYVYDPVSFKRVAELDANNYATFYIYDEEGQLTAVKKETTKGIVTLREGRSVIVPNN